MWTDRPPMSSPRISHFPVCSPARVSSPSSAAVTVTACAQRMARPGPSKQAMNPSPVDLISRPRRTGSPSDPCRREGHHRRGRWQIAQEVMYHTVVQSLLDERAGSTVSSNKARTGARKILEHVVLASLVIAPGLLVSTTTLSGAQGVDLYVSPAPPTATVGQPYSYQLQVVGGAPPYTFAVNQKQVAEAGDQFAPGFPEGLSMSSSGLITGTPLIAERSDFELFVTDAAGDSSGGRSLTMTVSTGNPTLDQTAIPLDTNALVLENVAQTNVINATVPLLESLPGFLLCVAGGPGNFCPL